MDLRETVAQHWLRQLAAEEAGQPGHMGRYRLRSLMPSEQNDDAGSPTP